MLDLSLDLAERAEWTPRELRHLDVHLDVSTFAFDTTSGLLAIGTQSGIVRLVGGPAVDIQLQNGSAIKSLQFAPSVFKLIVVDALNRLRVWDLASVHNADAKFEASTSLNQPISAISTSPSHSHVLVLLQSGELRAYDLVTTGWSPRPIPHLWADYEDKLMATGVISAPRRNARQAIDVFSHPRDLSLLFTAYEGGVALCDLTTHKLARAYELVLPPGAPGGSGYGSADIMTSRRPTVTAMAVHPSGHILAVGHITGEITFWAVEDEDKPITCITVDDIDVQLVNGEKLQAKMGTGAAHIAPEPIFKLSWSGFPNSDDPRGGETTLTILGGRSDDVSGVTVLWLPAFNPPEVPPAAGASSGVHATYREAMLKTAVATDSYVYATPTPVQDFLLFPKNTPHFGGTYDPMAILLLTEGQGGTRSLEARAFPPPSFISTPAVSTPETTKPEHLDVEAELAATLESMKVEDDPSDFEVPVSLWSGKNAPVQISLLKVEREAHWKLMGHRQDRMDLPLFGGQAWPQDLDDPRLIKFQAHRIAITIHQDLSIKFSDYDAQLLMDAPDEPLKSSFPRLATELTIDVLAVLAHSAVSAHFSPAALQAVQIASVHVAPESLDAIVSLDSGDVVVYKLATNPERYWEVRDSPLICLEHLPVDPTAGRRYAPTLMINARRGRQTCLAGSDIGLVAIAYEDGSLFVFDTRNPAVVLHELPEDKLQRRKSLFHRRAGGERVTNVSWTISGIKKESRPRVRLVVVFDSGAARVYTFDKAPQSGAWSAALSGDADGIAGAFADPDSSVVLDAKTGYRCRADTHGLTTALDPDLLAAAGTRKTEKHYIWVLAGAKGARVNMDVNGERIAKADWPSKAGTVTQAKVVERTDSAALIAFTDRCQALVYSIPELGLLHTLDLPYNGSVAPLLSVDNTGDYLLATQHMRTRVVERVSYGALFGQRRGFYKLPRVDLGAGRRAVPAQPAPVPLGPGSMLGTLVGYVAGPHVLTGEELDTLLAGRERPAPSTAGAAQPQARAGASVAGAGSGYAAPDVNALGQQIGQGATAVGQQIGQGATAVFGRLQSALSERGEMLGSLQDSMASLQEGSKNAVNQARVAAMKQGARGWFSSLG